MHILVILDRPETAPFILATARLLSEKVPDPTMKVLHPRLTAGPRFQSPDEGMPSADDRERFERDETDRSVALHGIFEEWLASLQQVQPTEWCEMSGVPRTIAAEQAGQADLTVLGRPLTDDPDYVRQAFDGVLYDARATVLITPLQCRQTLGAIR